MRALVIGCQGGSLGDAVEDAFSGAGWDVMTAGISGHEGYSLDITQRSEVEKFFSEQEPFNAVINTAGINEPLSAHAHAVPEMLEDHLLVNVIGHMFVLEEWLTHLPETVAYWTRHYVSISSNSAQVARSRSLPYCASKAALSMAIRCAARDLAGTATVYAYEPGLLYGTPMTDHIRGESLRVSYEHLHRMKGGPELTQGIRTGRLARLIFNNVRLGGPELNGCLLRVDGGEQ